VKIATLSIGELYLRLLTASFRVERGLVFERLALEDASLSRANNPLARMVFVEQDVLCLRSLAYEDEVLPRLRQHCKAFRGREKQRGELARRRQRILQKYLYGEHKNSTQIYLPAHEADPIFEMLAADQGEGTQPLEIEVGEADMTRGEEGEMRDCSESSQMDF
jgi:hypothetical protein